LAYSRSMASAVVHDTWPRATWMCTGTFAAVFVVPHDAMLLAGVVELAAVPADFEAGDPQAATADTSRTASATLTAGAVNRSLARAWGRRTRMADLLSATPNHAGTGPRSPSRLPD
jgi:hypothetical protein